mgnify:CR=1 FL=1
MNVKVYNQEGQEVGTAELPAKIFEMSLNEDLVYQVMVSQMANRRRVIAHTKGRGEVSGGGKKPWAQKHTGRARHGSIRSPIWKGGGVVGGPTKEKVYEQKIPKKMRRKALCMVLSEKAKGKFLVVLENLKLENPKTKMLAATLKKLPCREQKSLLILPEMNQNVIMAARNIPRVKTMQAKDMNVLDLLQSKYLVMPKKSVELITDIFTSQP